MTGLISRLRDRGENGETLIEILVAIVVMGIAATGLIAGLSNGVIASDSHRRLSSAETVLRAYGELIKSRVLHPASTTLKFDVPPFARGDNVTFTVLDASVFTDTTPFTISLDGLLMTVDPADINVGTGTITATAQASSLGVGQGAAVARYASCPGEPHQNNVTLAADETYFSGISTTTLTTDPRLKPPVIKSVTFYDNANNPISPTACIDWWSSAGTSSCSGGTDHRTACDPPWLRVTIEIDESAAGRASCANGVCAKTDVIIRRAA